MAGGVTSEVIGELMELGGDIICSERFAKAWQVPHHYEGRSIAHHSLETAAYTYRLARWLGARGHDVSVKDAVRASLLHDIGMTVDEVFHSPSYRKAYSHPREGARIARGAGEEGAQQVVVRAAHRHSRRRRFRANSAPGTARARPCVLMRGACARV